MGKDKLKVKDEDGAADAEPPNFYCRRNPTIPRQDQPRPYAFLQRILSEHRIRTDDVDQYGNVDDLGTSLNGAMSNIPISNDQFDSMAVQAGSGAIAAVQNGLNLREAANTLAETSGSPETNATNGEAATAAEPTSISAIANGNADSSDKVEVEEELPWFSQLLAYPQLRSAGIPLSQWQFKTKLFFVIIGSAAQHWLGSIVSSHIAKDFLSSYNGSVSS
ncbi:hypothetical protein NDA16_003321 [Ustilago loliicola]|nr:hypothetical protein NDA16_003321 [Ustilago loliicola]